MKYLVFDIETRNTFEQVGSDLPSALDLSVLSIFDSRDNSMKSFEMDENLFNEFEKKVTV